MHLRQQIREAAKSTLEGISLDVHHGAVTVFNCRRLAFQRDSYPAINIKTPSESSRNEVFGQLMRETDLTIQVLIEDKEAASADPDDYAEEIEKRMSATDALSGLDHDHMLTRTSYQDDPDNNLIQLTLVYSVTYSTTYDEPSISLP